MFTCHQGNHKVSLRRWGYDTLVSPDLMQIIMHNRLMFEKQQTWTIETKTISLTQLTDVTCQYDYHHNMDKRQNRHSIQWLSYKHDHYNNIGNKDLPRVLCLK